METIKIYKDYIRYIPDFIDPKSTIHKALWNDMSSISNIIMRLFSNNVLNHFIISNIHLRVEPFLESISDTIVNYGLGLDIKTYYEVIFLDFINISLDREEYEIAENLKNYYNLYVK
ncbi:MAG: hypothetical protein ACOVNU_00400 [Candidatus Kapaibacteriota bacterium]